MNNLTNNILPLIKELQAFDYKMESMDHIWNIIFPDLTKKNKWFHVRITQYQKIYYLILINGDTHSLEASLIEKTANFHESLGFSSRFNIHESEKIWEAIIPAARKWLNIVKKDWIKANSKVQLKYPLNCRTGIVPNALVRTLLPDVYQISKNLGKAKAKKFIQIAESNYFHNNKKITRHSMTAKDYFDYCKIAYLAAEDKKNSIDKNLTGKEMYKRFADGRDEGLLEINENSTQEFADWIDGSHPKKTTGGHPFEIKRGGNTTHIDLLVHRPFTFNKEGFKVELRGASFTRLTETIKMFLALYDAGLPISISDYEGVRKRLLLQDNVGIIPHYDSLHRANQNFSDEESVYDVLHYDDFGRYKRQIKPFITWRPLPILKPKTL